MINKRTTMYSGKINKSDFLFSKPIQKNNWKVFENNIFDDIEMRDCNDTTFGVCKRDLSLDECIDKCENNSRDYCSYGYYITDKNNNKKNSYCVPLKDYIQDLSPYFKLRNANNMKYLKNHNVKFFVNDKKWKFPADDTRYVFFHDNCVLENIETGAKLVVRKGGDGISIMDRVEFSKDIFPTPIHLLPIEESSGKNQIYAPALYNNFVFINVPETSLVLRKSYGSDFLEWTTAISMVSDWHTDIFFRPINNKSEIILWDEPFYIWYNHINTIILDDDMTLKSVYLNYEEAKEKGYNCQFRLLPYKDIDAYYCVKGENNIIPLNKATFKETKAFYKNHKLYRRPYCFQTGNLKNNENKEKNGYNYNYWILFLIFLVLFVIYYYNKNGKKQN